MSVPTSADEATSPEWLQSILGAEVRAVEAGIVDQRVSTNLPVHVDLADGRSMDLWIKAYFSDVGGPMRYAGVPEVMFYRDLGATVGLRTLRCLYAEVDDATGYNVLVTEDVVGQGATFLDARYACTAGQVAGGLEQLARLHADTWLDTACGERSWLDSRLEFYTATRGVAEMNENFGGPNGGGVPRPARDAERLYAAYEAVAVAQGKDTPWCVVHGDAHIGNVYLDGEGRTCFVDFQLVQRGPWYLDVGYHIASMLTVEDRRVHERDLVRHYLGCLQLAGIDPPDAATVDRGLRLGMLHGFYLWAITLKVEPTVIAAMLERLGTAVDDHNAFSEVEA